MWFGTAPGRDFLELEAPWWEIQSYVFSMAQRGLRPNLDSLQHTGG
jgi:hypothetical protein